MVFATHGLRAGLRYAPRHQLRAGVEVLLNEGAGTKVLGLRGFPSSLRPAAKWGWSPQGSSVEASSRVPSLAAWGPFLRAEHVNSCCDRLGTAHLGVYLAPCARVTTCLLCDLKGRRQRVKHKG